MLPHHESPRAATEIALVRFGEGNTLNSKELFLHSTSKAPVFNKFDAKCLHSAIYNVNMIFGEGMRLEIKLDSFESLSQNTTARRISGKSTPSRNTYRRNSLW